MDNAAASWSPSNFANASFAALSEHLVIWTIRDIFGSIGALPDGPGLVSSFAASIFDASIALSIS